FFFFQAEDGIRDFHVTGVQTCALPISWGWGMLGRVRRWAAAQQIDVINIQYQAAAYNMAAFIHLLPVRLNDVRVCTTFHDLLVRSEERRVGKECRSRWSTYRETEKVHR